MSYVPPASNAVNASWQGALPYTPPASNAVNASWAPSVLQGQISVPGPLGAPAVLGVASAIPDGVCAAPSPLGAVAALGLVAVRGTVAAASPLGAPRVSGLVVVRGQISAPSPLGSAKLLGAVVRYELRGEVRDQGVLVNRRVRAYRRATGVLVTEGDTVAGLFTIPVGFVADEYYLIPVNLDPAATDYAPPCANRVTSVLAMDATA